MQNMWKTCTPKKPWAASEYYLKKTSMTNTTNRFQRVIEKNIHKFWLAICPPWILVDQWENSFYFESLISVQWLLVEQLQSECSRSPLWRSRCGSQSGSTWWAWQWHWTISGMPWQLCWQICDPRFAQIMFQNKAITVIITEWIEYIWMHSSNIIKQSKYQTWRSCAVSDHPAS